MASLKALSSNTDTFRGLGARALTYQFWGDTVQCTTVANNELKNMLDYVMVELRKTEYHSSLDASRNGKLTCLPRKFLSGKMNTIHIQKHLTFTGFLLIYLTLTKVFTENR